MKLANIITITNTSKRDVNFKPRNYVDDNDDKSICIKSSSFKLIDYKKNSSPIDLDEMFLQFEDSDDKIKIEDAYKYSISLEYQLL